MQTVGVLLLAVGVWVMYCGTWGIDPWALAQSILKDPQNAQALISAARTAAASDVSKSITNTAVIGSGDGAAVVAFARKELGKPYRLGGHGPDVWDCSGLTMEAYASIGVTLPHSALAQSKMGVPIATKDQLQVGDLLFPTGIGTALGDHVQIYSGNGNIIEAPRPGVPVRERVMWGFSGNSVTARRYVKKAASTDKTAGNYYGSGPVQVTDPKTKAPAPAGTAGNYYGAGR